MALGSYARSRLILMLMVDVRADFWKQGAGNVSKPPIRDSRTRTRLRGGRRANACPRSIHPARCLQPMVPDHSYEEGVATHLSCVILAGDDCAIQGHRLSADGPGPSIGRDASRRRHWPSSRNPDQEHPMGLLRRSIPMRRRDPPRSGVHIWPVYPTPVVLLPSTPQLSPSVSTFGSPR